MTNVASLPSIGSLAEGDLFYARDVSDALSPDKKVTTAQVRQAVLDLSSLSAVSLTDADRIPVFDANEPSTPRYTTPAELRPAGAKITNHLRYAGNITIPAIAAGAEAAATITVNGAGLGDHVVFNASAALPAGLGVMAVYVSAASTVTVRFRNFSGAQIASADLACVALTSRSA